jgi:3-dehydroquinate synthetase
MSVDKKARDGQLRFILLDRIGAASIRSDVSAAALDETLALAA